MQLGPKIAEGKTKIIYAHPSDESLAVMFFKDDITAGDGAKHDLLRGKGRFDWETTRNVFAYLQRRGVPSHMVEAPEDNCLVVRKMKMIPLECVTRRIATGSLVKRLPFTEGQRFEPLMFELFLKDDARHDPFVNDGHAQALGVASHAELQTIRNLSLRLFKELEKAFAKQYISLVDLKVEFGRTADGTLLVGDDITNNSWRVWPHGRKEEMFDKQLYRDGKAPLGTVLEGFRKAAEITGKFL